MPLSPSQDPDKLAVVATVGGRTLPAPDLLSGTTVATDPDSPNRWLDIASTYVWNWHGVLSFSNRGQRL